MGVVRLRRAEPVTENELKSELKRCLQVGDIMSTKPKKPQKTKKLLLSKVDKAHVRATKTLKRARQLAKRVILQVAKNEAFSLQDLGAVIGLSPPLDATITRFDVA